MGRALSAAGNHTESVKCWKAMIQMDKVNPQLWVGLARSLEAAGDMATAQRCHQKAQTLSNPSPVSSEPTQTFSETPVIEIEPPQKQNVEPPTIAQNETVDTQIPEVGQPEEVIQIPLPELTARPEPEARVQEANPEVDLAAAALEASMKMQAPSGIDSNSNAIANQDIEWYNKGVGLIEDKKYREALSCFDRALPSFADLSLIHI